jgi:chromate transporter
MRALSWLYMAGENLAWIAAIFYGLQAAVTVIVAAAILRIDGKALNSGKWVSESSRSFYPGLILRQPHRAARCLN